jgi:hypothetical protein
MNARLKENQESMKVNARRLNFVIIVSRSLPCWADDSTRAIDN